MTVVSNTSPINYLLLVAEDRVLPALFGSIHLPAAVRAELSAPEAAERVREWAADPPTWACFHHVMTAILEGPVRLHPGETEAILLARELGAEALLMDELDGRATARAAGLTVIGTLVKGSVLDNGFSLSDFLRRCGRPLIGHYQELTPC